MWQPRHQGSEERRIHSCMIGVFGFRILSLLSARSSLDDGVVGRLQLQTAMSAVLCYRLSMWLRWSPWRSWGSPCSAATSGWASPWHCQASGPTSQRASWQSCRLGPPLSLAPSLWRRQSRCATLLLCSHLSKQSTIPPVEPQFNKPKQTKTITACCDGCYCYQSGRAKKSLVQWPHHEGIGIST